MSDETDKYPPARLGCIHIFWDEKVFVVYAVVEVRVDEWKQSRGPGTPFVQQQGKYTSQLFVLFTSEPKNQAEAKKNFDFISICMEKSGATAEEAIRHYYENYYKYWGLE